MHTVEKGLQHWFWQVNNQLDIRVLTVRKFPKDKKNYTISPQPIPYCETKLYNFNYVIYKVYIYASSPSNLILLIWITVFSCRVYVVVGHRAVCCRVYVVVGHRAVLFVTGFGNLPVHGRCCRNLYLTLLCSFYCWRGYCNVLDSSLCRTARWGIKDPSFRIMFVYHVT